MCPKMILFIFFVNILVCNFAVIFFLVNNFVQTNVSSWLLWVSSMTLDVIIDLLRRHRSLSAWVTEKPFSVGIGVADWKYRAQAKVIKIREEYHLHNHRCENLKSYTIKIYISKGFLRNVLLLLFLLLPSYSYIIFFDFRAVLMSTKRKMYTKSSMRLYIRWSMSMNAMKGNCTVVTKLHSSVECSQPSCCILISQQIWYENEQRKGDFTILHKQNEKPQI
jgi:hypothetical protein